ncbi:MAG: hypothetical protein CL663_04300 [Bacteroidetes bacterium]|nr:hypothetical protein [Bacteroidota bacterium]MBC35246.1 hypothetical protein [Bacteroidota bacterium]
MNKLINLILVTLIAGVTLASCNKDAIIEPDTPIIEYFEGGFYSDNTGFIEGTYSFFITTTDGEVSNVELTYLPDSGSTGVYSVSEEVVVTEKGYQVSFDSIIYPNCSLTVTIGTAPYGLFGHAHLLIDNGNSLENRHGYTSFKAFEFK